MADPKRGPGRARRTFGPLVLLGLASGALAAYAGSKPWVTAEGAESAAGGPRADWAHLTSSPLSTGLAFVVLACWGVLLVTRGRFRRGVALLAVVAALGNAVTVALSPGGLAERLRDEVELQTGTTVGGTALTGWFWLATLVAVLVLLSTALALRLAPAWPEMGTRYDAPTAAPSAGDAQAPAPTENIDIWKALDEGRDPTA
jgi:uncharacterized membrane protein (TIGR02234 family)